MIDLIAIPSENPGGLDANIGAHFGHCELYTLVSVQKGQVGEIKVIPNVPHQQGGCMAPVQHLSNSGVTQLIAGGIGLRPLKGFNQVGIKVYFGGSVKTVGEAVSTMLEGKLSEFKQQQTCSGCH